MDHGAEPASEDTEDVISNVEVGIAVCALVFSVVSFVLSTYTAAVAGRRGRMPALVFLYDIEKDQWVLRNVGNGPALDVVIAQRDKPTGKWFRPVRVPPLGRDDQFLLWWLEPERDYGLGARYQDMLVGGRHSSRKGYVTRTGNDVSRIYYGRATKQIDMPTWSDDDIERHWQLRTTVSDPSTSDTNHAELT